VKQLVELLLREPERVALLVGAGMSRSAGIDTGDDLLDILAARHGAVAAPAPTAWYAEAYGRWPSYEALLYEVHPVAPDADPSVFFEPAPSDLRGGRRVPQPAHRALARLVEAGYFRLILTTNFDRLIEAALDDANIPAIVASLPPNMVAAHASRGVRVVKLHGDYAELVPKLLADRQDDYGSAAIDALLADAFATHHVVVCGWSAAWDVALGTALASAPAHRRLYFTAVGGLSAEAAAIVRRRAATVVRISGADAFFAELATELIGDGQPPRPAITTDHGGGCDRATATAQAAQASPAETASDNPCSIRRRKPAANASPAPVASTTRAGREGRVSSFPAR
jgi:hypothetical protein